VESIPECWASKSRTRSNPKHFVCFFFSCLSNLNRVARQAGPFVRRALSPTKSCRDCARGDGPLTPFSLPASAAGLAWILLAATPRGIPAITLADQPGPLRRRACAAAISAAELARPIPSWKGWPGPGASAWPSTSRCRHRRWIWAATPSAGGSGRSSDPDSRGRTVELNAELARRPGEPLVRAVAQACGANPIARPFLPPRHRQRERLPAWLPLGP